MMRCALLLCAALCAAITDARDLSLHLNRIDPAVSPLAKCLDGTAPAYYFREGAGADASRVIGACFCECDLCHAPPLPPRPPFISAYEDSCLFHRL